MTDQLSPADQASVRSIVQGLENAWNTADGEAYAAAMADDADFVNVRADASRVGRPSPPVTQASSARFMPAAETGSRSIRRDCCARMSL